LSFKVSGGRVIQSSTPFRLAIVEGLDVRDSRFHNYPPRWNGAPSHEDYLLGGEVANGCGFSVPLFHRFAILGCDRRRSRRLSRKTKDKRVALLQKYARPSAPRAVDAGDRVTVVQ
jgi:hypothetical protein